MSDPNNNTVAIFKRISPYFVGSILAGTVLSVISSVVTLNMFLGWNFDSIHRRIDDSNRETDKDLNAFNTKLNSAVEALSETKSISVQLNSKLDQLDQDIQFIRQFTTEFSSYEELVLYGPEIISLGSGREPMGGPGEITPWPTYQIELPHPSSEQAIQNAEARVSALLESALLSSRDIPYDPAEHEIVVFTNVKFPFDGNPRVQVTAVSFNRENENDENEDD